MKFKLLLFLLLCATAGFAQINNQAGNLTLQDGRELQGTLTYYSDSPNKIIFEQQQGSKEIYTPKQVQQIKLNSGEKFVSHPFMHQDSLLLFQVLVESQVMSLYVREESGDKIFYVSKGDAMYRLENNEIIESEGGTTHKRKDNKYISTLSTLMPDRMDLVEKLYKIKLTESDLAAIVTGYNKGETSYFWNSGKKLTEESNWIFFAQYSQFGSIFGDRTVARSTGQVMGLQYYIFKGGRYSFKFSADYNRFYLNKENLTFKGLGIRYQHDLKKTDRFNLYFQLHLADIGRLDSEGEWPNPPSEKKTVFKPRLNPSLGVEGRVLPRTAIYAELNNIIFIENIPQSFSVGLKYDFGAAAW